MEYMSRIISLMYFLAAIIYLFWGSKVIRIHSKGSLNQAFFSLSIFLAIWSFGYSVANSAINPEMAFLWIRRATVGKMFLFSATLHFVVLLGNKEITTKNKRLLMLIHIPAFIMTYAFGISETSAATQYEVVQVSYGWVENPANNLWTLLFYGYFISYVLSSLILIEKWKDKLKNKLTRNQISRFYITFISALVLGVLIDIVSPLLSDNPLPKLTPLIGLFPVWVMYHSAKHYNVLNVERVKKEEIILSEDQQNRIFVGLSAGIIFSGFLAFFLEYYSEKSASGGDLRLSLLKGGILFALGLILYFIQRIRMENVKEIATMIVLVTSIPIVALIFVEYSTISVWVFPIVLIISSLLFSKRMMLISTTLSALVTQLLIWIIQPSQYVLVDKHDFTLRISVITFVYFLGSYINKIYLMKIKENQKQIAFQRLAAKISFDFVSLNQENSEEKIEHLLREIGSFFEVDRAYLLKINHEHKTASYLSEWCDCTINPRAEDIPLELYTWGKEQFRNKNLVIIEDVDSLPIQATAVKKYLQERDIESLMLVPVLVDGKVSEFIGVESVSSTKKWTDEKIKQLNILSNTLASGLIQIQADKEIEFMAYYDSLTKLPNRFLFEKKVDQAIDLSKRTGEMFSTILIDLDNFKSVNDTIGHEGGDILLVQLAKRLRVTLGEENVVAHFGGDNFLVLLNNVTNNAQITKIADKLMNLFAQPFTIQEQDFLITASTGIASYPMDGENYDLLIKHSDIAMYEAKSKGKNRYALFTEDMKTKVQENIELSNDLSEALKRDELEVYYQPQIDLVTNKITGVEALVRWNHPTRGMISPGVFIPIAENNGLINNLGEWVLKTATLQNKKWQDMGLPHITVAVNLSSIQILDQKLRDSIVRIIEETELDPKYIELEITETVAIEEANYVRDVLYKLKQLGVAIAIDDFGTDYSSLSRLSILPIDRIKIDMQFIQRLENSKKDKAITATIISLAKNLELNVLAEGVETVEQLAFLKQEQCDEVQGYYYYKPMPANEMQEILKIV